MNVEYINPFIESSISILGQTTGLGAALGKLYVRTTPYKSGSVMVFIGLTGKISGSVVLSFDMETACKISSAMMGGYPVSSLDEMAKSAIAELGNMIMGNTATIFSNKGIHIDITPPTVLTGDNMQLSQSKAVVVCIPFVLDGGMTMELDISYVENK